MYFIGFPNFITTKPFFSKLSKMSYALDLGTSPISLNSAAVEIPLDNKAIHIFASYMFKSNVYLIFFKNSSFMIIFINPFPLVVYKIFVPSHTIYFLHVLKYHYCLRHTYDN